jgi:diketogulonate reductase-like aldo/keto reductase
VKSLQGTTVPSFFYGTAWKEDRTETLARQALDAGFRAIDTANQRRHYVEAAVGSAVAAWLGETGNARESVFLQTKFTYARGQDHRLPYDPKADFETQVTQSFQSSLAHLQTSYVDSFLLHGPSTARGLVDADWAVWRSMEALQKSGKTRLIGVSNVTLEQLDRLIHEATVAPAFVQNRCYASTGWDREVRALCRANDIIYQAFSLLTANARELRTPVMEEIARRTGRTLPQIVFRFAIESGMIPLAGTSSSTHLAEDLACFDFSLDDDQRRLIESIAG